MRVRATPLAIAIAVALSAASLSVVTFGQSRATPATGTTGATTANYSVPRTAWGHPDMQGNWNAATLTPLERPDTAEGKLALTKEQAEAIARAEAARVEARARPSNPNRSAPVVGGNVGGYNNFWIDRGSSSFSVNGEYRTSIVIDPADGHIPPVTADARRRNAARSATPTSDAPESAGEARGSFDDMELRPLGERCLLGFSSTSGPPTLPNYFYNNFKQIVQTPDYVMILVEMVHDARIIRLNSQHLPATIRKWNGDSIGHFEGDTLIVETTNFTNKTRFRGSSENMKVIERFKRVDKDTILYTFTIEDPSTWARPWTGEYPWVGTTDLIYEYACHEGNYALGDIMRGARLLEKEAR